MMIKIKQAKLQVDEAFDKFTRHVLGTFAEYGISTTIHRYLIHKYHNTFDAYINFVNQMILHGDDTVCEKNILLATALREKLIGSRVLDLTCNVTQQLRSNGIRVIRATALINDFTIAAHTMDDIIVDTIPGMPAANMDKIFAVRDIELGPDHVNEIK